MTDFAAALNHLWPNGDERIPGLRAGMIATAPEVFAKYKIDSPLVLTHFMAQISHECGAGHDVVENLSYSAERLIEIWPRHFDRGNAQEYARNPQKLGNFIYNPPQHTDLGNRENSQDGYIYRGRGGCQTTGRAAYAKLQEITGLDLLANPDLINDPKNFMLCAVADFIQCGCLPYAKQDDIMNVTKRLNGGLIGIDQRRAWLKQWKALDVAVPTARVIVSAPPVHPPPDLPDHIPQPQHVPQPSIWAAFLSAILSIFKRK
jgi:putative chitinase